ncbi:hypothetical protein SAMN05421766_104451 [Zobellia uliginosa]|uniref:Uncharacterized protein n=1 Tax=Zobellia uliginosa TaxID=143224 RepID=A0ABY1KWS2_9FLAO|nr:hypothetical protein SAMN05421766_104451 [Zobellia uliginosa]
MNKYLGDYIPVRTEILNKFEDHNDFMQFVKRVRVDLKSNEIRKEKYDKILDEEHLNKLKKN